MAEVAKKIWTEDMVAELIQRMPNEQLHRPLMRLWERQTPREQASESTIEYNKKGFNSYDAGFASRMVDWWSQKRFFTRKQGDAIRKMLVKYRKQLADIANNRK